MIASIRSLAISFGFFSSLTRHWLSAGAGSFPSAQALIVGTMFTGGAELLVLGRQSFDGL